MLLLILSFAAGALTVLAPCILPLLPVIIGSSLEASGSERSRARLFTVTVALGVSVILFTLLLKVSTAFITIPPEWWTYISGGIVMLFGVMLLFPSLWERLPFMARLSSGSNRLVSAGYQKKNFWGDVIIGAALGPVFSTCSPTYFVVLATVLPERPLTGLVYLGAYAAGLCLMLLLIGFVGQKLADRLGVVADPRSPFKRALGFLFIAVGFFVMSGQDKKLQIQLLDWGLYDVTKVEQTLLRLTEPEKRTQESERVPFIFDEAMRIAKKEQLYSRAPEIMKPAGYVNTDGQPITVGEFKGKKIVLLDIWTYSCINCQRTIPYLKAWDEKYGPMGLQIIGIHTPEFAFEKDIENVAWAVGQFGIKYPTVLDNDYATWRALDNNYWPRKYLVDIDGFIIYDHAGEGAYEETEAAIQNALQERAVVLGLSGTGDSSMVADDIAQADLSGIGSPEIYFGAFRNERFGSGSPYLEGSQQFTVPSSPLRNVLYLGGTWNIKPEFAESEGEAKIVFKYLSKDVYMVAAGESPVRMRVLRDGKPVGEFAGADVDDEGYVTVREHRLYKLIHEDVAGEHALELEVEGAGLQAYTFTFG